MNEWELTDEEIAKARHNYYCYGPYHRWGEQIAIAKAAQRKLVEWLREPCYKHNASMLIGCPECWRNLRRGVDL